jgi:uroporphyrinogen decarboxylase
LKNAVRGRMLSVLEGAALSPPPIWLMRQAGRYLPEYREIRAKTGSFWAMCMTPAVAAEVTLQPIRRFGFDAAILFSDILVVPYAMGRHVDFEFGPKLEPIAAPGELDMDEDRWQRRLAPVYESIGLVRASIPRTGALLGFAGGPWTLATYLAEGAGSTDQRAAKLWGYRNPVGFSDLLRRLSDCVAFHLIRQIEAGADTVQIFDSWAGALAAKAFCDWVVGPTRRIVDTVRKTHPAAKIIGFPRAASLEGYLEYAEQTGVDAISLDAAVPMDWAAKSLPAGVIVQGNLDPIVLLAGGDAMSDAVQRISRNIHGRPFIFNLGHGVVPETPVEHVEALVAQVRAER